MAYHTSVLVEEVLSNLITDPSQTYLDGTLGGGGHAGQILSGLNGGHLIGLDRDGDAIAEVEKRFAGNQNVTIVHSPFSEMKKVVKDVYKDNQEPKLQGVLLDLGVSSHQLEESKRGFSFDKGGPLDMRMDNRQLETARTYLEHVSEVDLQFAFSKNSDLPKSKTLARAFKARIKNHSDEDLVDAVLKDVYPKGVVERPKLLSRIFQAIRMEVNQEKKQIEQGLKSAVELVRVGGRICVITFHSVEDRWVKQLFKQYEQDCICPQEIPLCQCGGKNKKLRKVHKKPLMPTLEEISGNSRARSAKLRVVERVGE